MPKPLTNLQHAAKQVLDSWDQQQAESSLAHAVRQLGEALEASLDRKPVGRPRTRPHDPAKGKSCMCIDCRKRRQVSAAMERNDKNATRLQEEKSTIS